MFSFAKKCKRALMRAATPYAVFFGCIVSFLLGYTGYIVVGRKEPINLGMFVACQVTEVMASLIAISRRLRVRDGLAVLDAAGLVMTETIFRQARLVALPRAWFRTLEFGVVLGISTYAWFFHGDPIPTGLVAASAAITLMVYTSAFAIVSILLVFSVSIQVYLAHAHEIGTSPVYISFLVLAGLLALMPVRTLAKSLRASEMRDTDLASASMLVIYTLFGAVMCIVTAYCTELGISCSSFAGASVVVVTMIAYVIAGLIEGDCRVHWDEYVPGKSAFCQLSRSPWNIRGFIWQMALLSAMPALIPFFGTFSPEVFMPIVVYYGIVAIGFFRETPPDAAHQPQVQRPPEVVVNQDLEARLLQ